MILHFLGTSSGAPTTKRNVSGLAVWFTQRGKWWLFDCGEGTQHQLMRSPLKLSQLEKIFITHLHGDHLYGLIGLLASRSLRGGAPSEITLFGPPGLDEYFHGIMRVSPVHLQYPLSIRTICKGQVYEDEEMMVTCAKVEHRVPAYGYAIMEKPRKGAFQVDLAKEQGIPPGPLYGKLKQGETIQLPDGRIFQPEQFLGPSQPGRKIVVSGDTSPCQAMVELAKDSDVLVHEATYAHPHLELAERSGHSTALQAARIAVKAGVKTLILTHFSPRYEDEEGEISLNDLLMEATELHPETMLAHDFMQVMVKRSR
ncbi:ribonuclease Z [Brevibacillus ginsengisoli]|uniref:ribonuclease Z n=1 Tax=Brevibacillus ginsengisoli TaxID=363854 RepID=UPI003CEC8F4D